MTLESVVPLYEIFKKYLIIVFCTVNWCYTPSVLTFLPLTHTSFIFTVTGIIKIISNNKNKKIKNNPHITTKLKQI